MQQGMTATGGLAWRAPGDCLPAILALLRSLGGAGFRPVAMVRGDASAASRARGERMAVGAGDFHGAMLPHLDAAYNLARFLSRDADAAEDIVQDAFLRAWRGFEQFRGGDARSWVLTIVRNCYRTWRADTTTAARRTEPMPEADGADGGLDNAALAPGFTDADTPESQLLRRDEAANVRAAIEALPEPFREVMVLRELADLSYREIAEDTAVPIGTVMSRLARARDLFRAEWCRSHGSEDFA